MRKPIQNRNEFKEWPSRFLGEPDGEAYPLSGLPPSAFEVHETWEEIQKRLGHGGEEVKNPSMTDDQIESRIKAVLADVIDEEVEERFKQLCEAINQPYALGFNQAEEGDWYLNESPKDTYCINQKTWSNLGQFIGGPFRSKKEFLRGVYLALNCVRSLRGKEKS